MLDIKAVQLPDCGIHFDFLKQWQLARQCKQDAAVSRVAHGHEIAAGKMQAVQLVYWSSTICAVILR